MKQLLKTKWGMVALLLAMYTLVEAQPKIQLQEFSAGFNRPVDIAHCGDSRLFIVEQRGIIWIVDSLGVKRTTPFLNIDPRVNSSGNEQGLLGLAFPPNFAETGFFYVNYTQNNGDTRISRFSLMTDSLNVADPNSEQIMIEFDQPYSNHNGGCIKFGPDGYLYISEGDGGSGGDPLGNGQKKNTFLAKMLRIDVNEPNPPYYKVPEDNPFVGQSDYYPEIWSLGLRNVWRFSFDRLTGDMWMGDVGQNLWEEIDYEPAGMGGRNYGWRCYEGDATYNTSGCQPASSYIAPVFDYSHAAANGCSVTGGFVYRGSKYPDLYGKYLFADYCSGRWWYTAPDGNGGFTTTVLANLSAYEYSTFGEDKEGELYVAALGAGKIYKIRELCSGFSVGYTLVQATCIGEANGWVSLVATGGVSPITYTWDHGPNTPTLTNLVGGETYSVIVKDGNQCAREVTFQEGAVFNPGTPVVTIASGQSVLCPDSSVVLQASSPAQEGVNYQWLLDGTVLPNATDSTLATSEPGSYSMQWTVTGSGCPPVVSEPFDLDQLSWIGAELVYANGQLTTADAFPGYSFQWLLDNVAIPGATSAVYTPTESGSYSLQLTSPEGCGTETIALLVTGTKLPVSLKSLTLSPNPTDGRLMIQLQLAKEEQCTFKLIDSKGQLLTQKQTIGQSMVQYFDLSAMASGVYFVFLELESGTVIRKVVRI